MSERLDTTLSAIQQKLDAGDFDGSVRFDIEGMGVIRIADGKVSAEDGAADVTIAGDAETFQALMDGEMSATEAFMTQKIRVEGDMGVAMQLGSLFA